MDILSTTKNENTPFSRLNVGTQKKLSRLLFAVKKVGATTYTTKPDLTTMLSTFAISEVYE